MHLTPNLDICNLCEIISDGYIEQYDHVHNIVTFVRRFSIYQTDIVCNICQNCMDDSKTFPFIIDFKTLNLPNDEYDENDWKYVIDWLANDKIGWKLKDPKKFWAKYLINVNKSFDDIRKLKNAVKQQQALLKN